MLNWVQGGGWWFQPPLPPPRVTFRRPPPHPGSAELRGTEGAEEIFGLNQLVRKAAEKIFDWLKARKKIWPNLLKGGRGGGAVVPSPGALGVWRAVFVERVF